MKTLQKALEHDKYLLNLLEEEKYDLFKETVFREGAIANLNIYRSLDSSEEDLEIIQQLKEIHSLFLKQFGKLMEEENYVVFNYILKTFPFDDNTKKNFIQHSFRNGSEKWIIKVCFPYIGNSYDFDRLGKNQVISRKDKSIAKLCSKYISWSYMKLTDLKSIDELRFAVELKIESFNNLAEPLKKTLRNDIDDYFSNKISNNYNKNNILENWKEEYDYLRALPEIQTKDREFYAEYLLLKLILKRDKGKKDISSDAHAILGQLASEDPNFKNATKYMAKLNPEIKIIQNKLDLKEKLENKLDLIKEEEEELHIPRKNKI